MLEQADPPATVDLVGLIADRVTQHAALPAERRPAVADRTVDLMRTGDRGPIDRAVLKMVVPADAIRCHGLVRQGVAEEALGKPGGVPLADDRAIDLVPAGRRHPIYRAACEILKTADATGAVVSGPAAAPSNPLAPVKFA